MKIKLWSAQESKKLNLRHTDYHPINQIVMHRVLRIHENTESLEIVDMVSGIIEETCKYNIPRKCDIPRKVPWWSPELSTLQGRMNRARRWYIACCLCHVKEELLQVYITARRDYKTLIARRKEDSWAQFGKESMMETPFGLVEYKLGTGKLRLKDTQDRR